MGGVFGKTGDVMVSEDVRIFVDNTIKMKRVVVFSKTYCPYARKGRLTFALYDAFKHFVLYSCRASLVFVRLI